MPETNMQTVETLAKVLEVLPADKQEFLLGYAEGVIAMAKKAAERDSLPVDQAS